MYYRLTDEYALRSWKFVPRAVFGRTKVRPLMISNNDFLLLRICDGEHDLPECDAIKSFCEQGIIEPCNPGEHPSAWSAFRQYDHRCVLSMNLMITGKCNYNCRHCFNAADNADVMEEWGWDELIDLLDQAEACGIHCVILNGGEPMLYPRFLDVVQEIYKRGMVLEALTTNGYFLTEEVLDFFLKLRCDPLLKISFDGIGHHDWMRGHPGAEEHTIKVLRMCKEKGFRTMVQTQVFSGNLDTMKETVCMLEELGVTQIRMIRTVESLRWNQNVEGSSIPLDEYLDIMLDFADWYMHGDHHMLIKIWQYLELDPHNGSYRMVKDQKALPTVPVCVNNRAIMSITNEGLVIPCLPMGAYVSRYGYHFDSLKERSLKEILKGGTWLNAVCANHYDMKRRNQQCGACEWFSRCGGGCRAVGMMYSGEFENKPDYFGADPIACMFFKGGWYEKVKTRLKDFRCVNKEL